MHIAKTIPHIGAYKHLNYLEMQQHYLQERDNLTVRVFLGIGFVHYRINPDNIFLQDMFVQPELRLRGYGKYIISEMEKEARKQGKKHVVVGVWTAAKNSNDSLRAALAAGFKLMSQDNDTIYLSKSIEKV